jgi:hypothetical protein
MLLCSYIGENPKIPERLSAVRGREEVEEMRKV